jgi:VWFA-related protein
VARAAGPKSSSALFVLLALVLALRLGAAQKTANPPEMQAHETTPQFRIRAERNLVLVRVVVRDDKGRTVGNLHKEDFRLLDDGKPQEIADFSVEVANPKPQAAQPLAAPAAPAATAAPPAAVVPQRFVGLFFDDYHTETEGVMRTRQAAWRYVQTTVRPQDRVAIFTATGKDQLDFTRDQAKLHEALYHTLALPHSPSGCPAIDDYEAYLAHILNDPDALVVLHTDAIGCVCGETVIGENRPVAGMGSAMERTSGRGFADPCPPQAERQGELEAAGVWARADAESLNALDAVERSVRRLAAMPGQRSLVLVSPGFLTETQGEKVDAITDRALQQQVVVSAIDAAGLVTGLPTGVTNVALPSIEVIRMRLKRTGAVAMSGVLAYLSSDTGGVFFHNSNDFAEGFREAAAVPEVYYVLSFSPQDVKLNGKFHSLKVSLTNPGHLSVQARRGYFASEATLVEKSPGASELERAVFSLEEVHGLPAEVSAKVEKLNDQKSKLIVSIHVNIASLRYRQEAGRSVDTLIFDTALFDRDGKYVASKEASIDLNLSDATLERFSKSGIVAQTNFEVGPGTYRVREVVRDRESTGTAALNCDAEVPGGAQ